MIKKIINEFVDKYIFVWNNFNEKINTEKVKENKEKDDEKKINLSASQNINNENKIMNLKKQSTLPTIRRKRKGSNDENENKSKYQKLLGKINNIKQITEKETALYFSDLIVIENCIKNFMNVKSDNDLYNCVKEVSDIFDSLKNTCFDIITQLVTEVSTSFIREFNTLNFNNYKTFQNAKEYNSYIKKLTPLKRLYDNIGNAFSEENIKKIFKKVFEDMFNQFKQSVTNKGIIEKDDQLKQFRNEMNYIKKVFKLFNMIDCSKQKEIIDELSIKVNPNKLPKKKKKTKQEKEDDNAD